MPSMLHVATHCKRSVNSNFVASGRVTIGGRGVGMCIVIIAKVSRMVCDAMMLPALAGFGSIPQHGTKVLRVKSGLRRWWSNFVFVSPAAALAVPRLWTLEELLSIQMALIDGSSLWSTGLQRVGCVLTVEGEFLSGDVSFFFLPSS